MPTSEVNFHLSNTAYCRHSELKSPPFSLPHSTDLPLLLLSKHACQVAMKQSLMSTLLYLPWDKVSSGTDKAR